MTPVCIAVTGDPSLGSWGALDLAGPQNHVGVNTDAWECGVGISRAGARASELLASISGKMLGSGRRET